MKFNKREILLMAMFAITVGIISYFVFSNYVFKDKNIIESNNNNNNNNNNDIKEENYDFEVESKLGNLDIKNSVVTTLVYPKYNTSSGYLNFVYTELEADTLFRDYKMISAYKNQNSEDNDLIYDDVIDDYKIKANIIKERFIKMFGPDSNYTDGSLSKIYCGNIYEYNKEEEYYIVPTRCGGVSSYSWNNKVKLYKAEQIDDYIFTYFYVMPYLSTSSSVYIYDKEPNSYDDMYDFDKYQIKANGYKKAIEKEEYYSIVDQEKDVSKLFKEMYEKEELATYKFTFKKQSDGKHYIYSGNWEK